MSANEKLEKLPALETDEDAERFVAKADLSRYDLSGFEPMHFEFENKTARVNMRLPQNQLDRVKAEAKKRGIPYQRLMRELIERGMQTLLRDRKV